MVDANDTAADDGQWTTTTENAMDIIDGPGPPQGAVSATVHEGGKVNNDEDMNNVSLNTRCLGIPLRDELVSDRVQLQGRYAPRRAFKNPQAAQNSRLL